MKQVDSRNVDTYSAENLRTAAVDFDDVLELPLIRAMQTLCAELFGQNFWINRFGGETERGESVQSAGYFTLGFPARNPFCRQLLQHMPSNQACSSVHPEFYDRFLRRRTVDIMPCRFQNTLQCQHVIPIETRPGLMPGMALLSGLRRAGSVVEPFDRILPILKTENPDYDWHRLESLYDASRVVDPGLIDAFCALLRLLLVVATADWLNRPHAERAAAPIRAMPTLLSSHHAARNVEAMHTARLNDLPVILEGEAGTGKETLARLIHDGSARRQHPFVVVPCALLSPDLIEAELFGYEKGAFSGALQNFAGFFERARGGALYFDEISEFSPDVQSRLLRVLESGEYRRIGSSQPRHANLRIYTGTRRDLRADMEHGRLLPALYYRIHGVHIALPPLRDMPEDIPAYVEILLEELAGGGPPRTITAQAMRALERYPWPDNLRQLRDTLRGAAALTAGKIGLRHLPEEIRAILDKDNRIDEPSHWSYAGLQRRLRDRKQRHIEDTLERAGGNASRAAKWLGISRFTLYKHLRDGRREDAAP